MITFLTGGLFLATAIHAFRKPDSELKTMSLKNLIVAMLYFVGLILVKVSP